MLLEKPENDSKYSPNLPNFTGKFEILGGGIDYYKLQSISRL